MFHRRRASSHSTASRHIPPTSPTPSAAAAATQAFAKSSNPNGALSSAAAAAALRSRPTPPTSVADAPSSRINRRDSNGSSVSGGGNQRPDTLQRRGSSGSMTERTFRSPSPGRGNPTTRTESDAPPVPAVPRDIAELERVSSSHRRTASLEPPLRVYSPPPTRPGGRGASLDRALHSPTSPKTPSRVSRLEKVNELERIEKQRSSVNFSRPMSPPGSPQGSQQRPQSVGYFTTPVASGQTPRQTLEVKPKATQPPAPTDVSFATPKSTDVPLKKKIRRARASSAEGSHLAAGTTKLAGTALESDESSGEVYNQGDSGNEPPSPVGSDRAQPRHNRPSHYLLSKQPSVVHERPESEELGEEITSANTGKKVDTSLAKPALDSSRYATSISILPSTGAPRETKVTGSNDTPRLNGNSKTHLLETDQFGRQSASPSRTAHFGALPIYDTTGVKHSPPGRSVSPYKSALKHSPSSSLRTISPEARFPTGHSRTGSEPRKTARVSFDDTPITVMPELETSKFAPPSNVMSRRMSDEDLEEDSKKPRPALPSFGSVRERKDLEETRNLPRSSGRRTPSPMSHSGSTLIGGESSNDHAVGGILAQDFAHKQSVELNAPLPPEATTVEGTGYNSDSDSTYTMDSNMAVPDTADSITTGVTLPKDMLPPESVYTEAVPSLALIPPTPAAEEVTDFSIPAPEEDRSLSIPAAEEDTGFSIPGAFPAESDNVPVSRNRPSPEIETPHHQSVGNTSTPITAANLRILPLEEESDSDTSSIYSDAAEDPSEYGAYQSLDAILETPLSERRTDHASVLPASVESQANEQDEAPPSPTAEHWDTTTAYWRGLSEKRKEELEHRALAEEKEIAERHEVPIGDQTTQPTTDPQPTQKKAKVQPMAVAPQPAGYNNPKASEKPRQSAMKRTMRASPDSEQPESAPPLRSALRNSGRTDKPEQGNHMRSSLRNSGRTDEPEQGTHMRSSLRNSGRKDDSEQGTHMRSSLRNSGRADEAEQSNHMRSSLRSGGNMPTSMRGQAGGLGASRWSGPSASREPKAALQKKNLPMAPPATATSREKSQYKLQSKPPSMSNLQRTGSADSASSFKRQRSKPTNQDGKVTMRRSMRDGSPQAGIKSSKFSVRSMSPAASTANYHMRSSLRGSVDSSAPTLRTPEKKSRFKSPTRFGKKQSPKTAPPATGPSPPHFNSRFGNDSDDEDVPRTTFVSRFADSDDEVDSPSSPTVMPTGLAPVRGIPRKAGDDYDSTDLEDESGDDRPRAKPEIPSIKDIEAAHQARPANNRPEGAALANGSLRGPMDGLAASKHAPVRPGITEKRRLSFLGLGKSRSSSVPNSNGRPGTSDSGSRPPKLQRRVTPKLPQVPEDTWPLPPKIGGATDEDRPNTSEGVIAPRPTLGRPNAGRRSNTAEALTGYTRQVSFSNDPIYSNKTGKKKKFPRLRRMFGLND